MYLRQTVQFAVCLFIWVFRPIREFFTITIPMERKRPFLWFHESHKKTSKITGIKLTHGLLFLQNNLFLGVIIRLYTVENMQGRSTEGEADGIEQFYILQQTQNVLHFFPNLKQTFLISTVFIAKVKTGQFSGPPTPPSYFKPLYILMNLQ